MPGVDCLNQASMQCLWFLCNSQLLWTLCTQAIPEEAAAGCLMGSVPDACFSTACNVHRTTPCSCGCGLLCWPSARCLSLVLLHPTRDPATPLSPHHHCCSADCGMATFEDPTLVEKLDSNLGPEAAATAKKMKFLNFFVSLAWPGLVLRTAGYQMTHHSRPQHMHLHPQYSSAEQLPKLGQGPLLSCACNMQSSESLLTCWEN